MQPPTKEQIKEIINKFGFNNASLVIPILQAVQEKFGYVPPESLGLISKHTNVARNKIYGVLTFYAQFATTPRGKYILRPCQGTACHVKGAKNILGHIKSKLGVNEGETTPDYKFTVEPVACLGTCFLAPAMMVNQDYYGNLDEKKAEEILNTYQ
jgi:NADH-quinone oxidoreductase subunit E